MQQIIQLLDFNHMMRIKCCDNLYLLVEGQFCKTKEDHFRSSWYLYHFFLESKVTKRWIKLSLGKEVMAT